jgi:hypothetical protein
MITVFMAGAGRVRIYNLNETDLFMKSVVCQADVTDYISGKGCLLFP